MEHFDVIVVGAGWYGLIAAHTYLELAPETNLLIVDDSATVGGVWSKERVYPTLFAQISHSLFEYSFYPMSKDGLSPDGFISGNTIHTYLNNFANDFDLTRRMRLNTRVVQVQREDEGRGWTLRLREGGPLSCKKLIYATGANSSPNCPKWPRSDFEKPVIHSLDVGKYVDHISNEVRRATVVGRSKSSYDAVFQLLNEGKKVDWVMRDGASGPFAIYAPTFLGLWNIADHISTRLAANFSPCIMNTEGLGYQFLQRTRVGRALTDVYWRVADYMSTSHAEYWKTADTQKLRPRPYGNGVFWGSGAVGIATVHNFWKTFHAGDVKIHSTEIESLSNKDVVNLKNGYALATDIVIHCTGFDKGYDVFSCELQDELGLSHDRSKSSVWADVDEEAEKRVAELLPFLSDPPEMPFDQEAGRRAPQGPNRHFRRLVVPKLAAQGDRSILFPGHIHSAFTPLAAELQALWGVTWMLGWRDLPSEQEMDMEAAMFNAWARMRYLEQGRKHSYFIYDYISYIDTLMKDLGLNPYRKSSLFEEVFVRYKPSDYKGLVNEYLALRRQRITGDKGPNRRTAQVDEMAKVAAAVHPGNGDIGNGSL